MTNNFESFVERLQSQIFIEAKKVYGELGFDRWRSPKFMGKIKDADGYARITGGCGDTMEIFLKFDDKSVTKASYITDGCVSSRICGSFAAELAIGKTPEDLSDITGEMILHKIGSFPDDEKHCAFLAARAIQEALNDYMIRVVHKNKKK
mgnify:CR=1 FL=1